MPLKRHRPSAEFDATRPNAEHARRTQTIWGKAIISRLRVDASAFDLPPFSPYLHILIIQRSKNAALDVRRSLVAIFHRVRVARVRSNGHLLEALSIRYSAIDD